VRRGLIDAAPAVRRFIFGMCGDWHVAEDVAQEAMLKAWRSRGSFDGRADARTWIFAIARNQWRDFLRRRSGRRETSMSLELTETAMASPPARAEQAEQAEAVDRALETLPPEQREALALRESQGLSFAQIGELLDVPPATAKSRVRYALTKLAEQLKRFGPELGA